MEVKGIDLMNYSTHNMTHIASFRNQMTNSYIYGFNKRRGKDKNNSHSHQ